MRLKDLLIEALLSITANKTRTFLTVLGIVIGISSVISLISIGQGAQSSVKSQIGTLGSNLLTVSMNFNRNSLNTSEMLTTDDVKAIEKISLVKAVAPQVSTNTQIVYKGAGVNTQIIGTNDNYDDVRNITIDKGSFISSKDVTSYTKVAVVGPTAAENILGENREPLNETIKIDGIGFKIIGVTKTKGQSGMTNQDNMIYIPISTAQRYLTGNDSISSINIGVISENAMNEAKQQVTLALLKTHNIADSSSANFTVSSQTDVVETISSVSETFTLLLAAIAAISLVVGGIGIMNMMLTNVTERTKEIGLRKAIGASSTDIVVQFLTEAILLTSFGGIIGTLLGVLLSYVLTQFFNIATTVSVSSIVLAVGVSAGIGLVFGFYPAKRAARLDPIQSLRYE
ncbi:FtsX-like permease family protein [candidate division WWE3 bacterium]|nr:FtsX-like permease family protein [candidate division WWE3 bacterium]